MSQTPVPLREIPGRANQPVRRAWLARLSLRNVSHLADILGQSMAVTGTLATMPPYELFQWLGTGRKSGSLTVIRGELQKKILFEDGWIVSSASTDPRNFLGQYLVEQGVVTAEEQSKAIEMQEQLDMSVGKILVLIGALTEEELVRFLCEKAHDEIAEIFAWGGGSFVFEPNEASERESVPMKIDVARVLLEGSRRADERVRFTDELTEDSWDSMEVDFQRHGEGGVGLVVVDDGDLRVYHQPGCHILHPSIEHRRTFRSRIEAESENYEACGECKP